jgi:hypothetical protein
MLRKREAETTLSTYLMVDIRFVRVLAVRLSARVDRRVGCYSYFCGGILLQGLLNDHVVCNDGDTA